MGTLAAVTLSVLYSPPATASPVSSGFDAAYFDSAINVGGQVVDFYYDHASLKEASPSGSGYQISVLDGATASTPGAVADAGQFAAATVVNGLPEVFYYSASDSTLRLATYSGSEWQLATLDGAGSAYAATGALTGHDEGQGVSVTLVGGSPVLFYDDITTHELREGWQEAGTWHFQTLVGSTLPNFNPGTSGAAVTIDGEPEAMVDTADGLTRVYHDADGWHRELVESSYEDENPTALVDNGQLAVFYRGVESSMWEARLTGSGWQKVAIDGYATVANPTSIDNASLDVVGDTNAVVEVEGRLNVWYDDTSANTLRHATETAPGHWQVETIDGGEDNSSGRISAQVGEGAAAAVDNNGVAQVFYRAGVASPGQVAVGTERHTWFAQDSQHYESLECSAICPSGPQGATQGPEGNDSATVIVNGELQIFTAGASLDHYYFDGDQWHHDVLEPAPAVQGTQPQYPYVAAVVVNGLPDVFYVDTARHAVRELSWRNDAWSSTDVDVAPQPYRVQPGMQLTAVANDDQPELFYKDDISAPVMWAHPDNNNEWTVENTGIYANSGLAAFVESDGSHFVTSNGYDLVLASRTGGAWSTQFVDGPDAVTTNHTSDQVFSIQPAATTADGNLDLFYATYDPHAPNHPLTLRHANLLGGTWTLDAVDGPDATAGEGQITDSVGASISATYTDGHLVAAYTLANDSTKMRIARLTNSGWSAADLDGWEKTATGEILDWVGHAPQAIVMPSGELNILYGGGPTIRDARLDDATWRYESIAATQYQPPLHSAAVFGDQYGGARAEENTGLLAPRAPTVQLLGGTADGGPAVTSVEQAGALTPYVFITNSAHQLLMRRFDSPWTMINATSGCLGTPAASTSGQTISVLCRTVSDHLRAISVHVPDNGLPTAGLWHGLGAGHVTRTAGIATVKGTLTYFVVRKGQVLSATRPHHFAAIGMSCDSGVSAASLDTDAAVACRTQVGAVQYVTETMHGWSSPTIVHGVTTPTDPWAAIGTPAVAATPEGFDFYWRAPHHVLEGFDGDFGAVQVGRVYGGVAAAQLQ